LNFIEQILDGFKHVGEWIVDGFTALFNLLAKPLSYLYYFLDGIFYFITVLFDIAIKVINIFVALFQFIGALILGFVRTLQMLLTPSFSAPVNLPSSSNQGLNVVLDLVAPMGILNIVPYICLAFVWFFFVMRILALFGGQVVAKGGN
jgi:hypothetical protein